MPFVMSVLDSETEKFVQSPSGAPAPVATLILEIPMPNSIPTSGTAGTSTEVNMLNAERNGQLTIMPSENHMESEMCEKPGKISNEFIVYSRKNLD
ncbi:hypothetical protein CK203_029169 [Vitis vinifera]|uniref:Uncharacterized protein n=1 Tax=Vitis vinifera TaxID=29760 RepID=A0A438ISX8_VITVI|nr:hypothetical protein CK203_029169 [Vitis vinifera]